ncbi:MAG: cobalamin biosynthesis protein [Candidatus Brocadiales bacterium]
MNAPLAILILTKEGLLVAKRLKKGLPEADLYLAEGAMESSDCVAGSPLTQSMDSKTFSSIGQLTKDIFHKYDGLIFIMALGIAIRAVAPHIKDKHSDPAVVVVDDVGRFVISALSGHEGGANTLAVKVASILHTEAVITTGTEARKDIIVGLGCKATTSAEAIKKAVMEGLNTCGLPLERVRLLATIKERAELPEVVKATQELGIPIRAFPSEEIATCTKKYTRSKFVEEKMGIGGVCEPAALLAGRKTKLILKKQKLSGVTIAIAQENLMW